MKMLKLKFTKKEDVFIIVLGLILVFIVFAIVIITTINSQTSQNISPTPRPLSTPAYAEPTNIPKNVGPPVNYDMAASNKLLDYFNNRRPLTNNDMTAKANILTLLPSGTQSGVIYESADYSIEYVHSADIFLVEITTSSIQNAKNEADLWFQAHGISQTGICTLPVEFYMNRDAAEQLRYQNITFSPLPNGC